MAFLSPPRLAILCGLAVTLVGATKESPAPAPAAPMIVGTRAVHAAFTINLTRFVTWPPEAFSAPDAPLLIGTFPRDPINAELDAAVRDEVVAGHPLQTIRLQSFEDVAKCHVVFLSKDETRPARVLRFAVGKPILTISDAEGFLELGGHVRLVPQPPNVRLSISIANLKQSRLEARAQLLRIAASP